MTNPNEIVPDIIFYSYLSSQRKEKCCFFSNCVFVMVISGQLVLETAVQKITVGRGGILLIGKNQLAQLTKTPLPGEDYETVVISLQEDLLRKIAQEEKIEVRHKYTGPPNIAIPGNQFLEGYFQSVLPYVRNSSEKITTDMGILKVNEGVKLLLHAMPELRSVLFDFSEPHKIDLEKYMHSNFHFNIPVEKFAQLTGRSIASFKRDFKKTFGTSPRHWLLEKRLNEARHLIESKNKKPSAIYLDLGFESLSHFSHSFKKKFGMAPTAMAQ